MEIAVPSRSRLVRRHPRILARLLRLTTDSVQSVGNGSRFSRLRVIVVGRLLKIYRRLQDYIRRVRALSGAKVFKGDIVTS